MYKYSKRYSYSLHPKTPTYFKLIQISDISQNIMTQISVSQPRYRMSGSKIPNSMIVSDLVEEGNWPNKNAFKENQTSQRTKQAFQGNRCFQRKNQLALNKTSKALHRSQNAFPNIRCQTSLKICSSGIGCQLKFHGSDISFMAQISDIRLKNFQTARLNQIQFKENNCPNKMHSKKNQASFQQRTETSTLKKTDAF